MKIIWAGEWITVRPMMNRRFVPDDPSCEICHRASCATAWFSLKTKRIRCKKCFAPEGYK